MSGQIRSLIDRDS